MKPKKTKGAKLKGTVAAVATMCIVCSVFIASLMTSGCNEKESSKMDDESFFKNLIEAPLALSSKDYLPEWLKETVEYLESGGELGIPGKAQFFRGSWNKQVTYYIRYALASCLICDVFYENGKRIVWKDLHEAEKFKSESKDWVKIYQIGPDIAFEHFTKS